MTVWITFTSIVNNLTFTSIVTYVTFLQSLDFFAGKLNFQNILNSEQFSRGIELVTSQANSKISLKRLIWNQQRAETLLALNRRFFDIIYRLARVINISGK